MYKNKDKERDNRRDNMRSYRKRKAITPTEEITKGVTPSLAGVCMAKLGEEITPDIILKLTDPVWRGKLEKICDSFDRSHHPEYKEDCWLGVTNLSLACGYLSCLE